MIIKLRLPSCRRPMVKLLDPHLLSGGQLEGLGRPRMDLDYYVDGDVCQKGKHTEYETFRCMSISRGIIDNRGTLKQPSQITVFVGGCQVV